MNRPLFQRDSGNKVQYPCCCSFVSGVPSDQCPIGIRTLLQAPHGSIQVGKHEAAVVAKRITRKALRDAVDRADLAKYNTPDPEVRYRFVQRQVPRNHVGAASCRKETRSTTSRVKS